MAEPTPDRPTTTDYAGVILFILAGWVCLVAALTPQPIEHHPYRYLYLLLGLAACLFGGVSAVLAHVLALILRELRARR